MHSGEVFEMLVGLGNSNKHGVYLQPKADEVAIRGMQAASRRNLGEPVPADYVSFLRITNGVQINGAYFKEAENLVAENLDVPRPGIMLLGNEGNMVEYVFERQDRRFHVINMGFPEERFASYDTFGEMLLAVMREQCLL